MKIVNKESLRGHISKLADHFIELDLESKYRRFFNNRSPDMIHDWLLSMVEHEFLDQYWILKYEKGRIIGAVQIILDNTTTAEIVISVSTDHQNNGIGTRLLNRAFKLIKEHPDIEVVHVDMEFLANNTRIAHLASRFGFISKYENGVIRSFQHIEEINIL